MIPVIPAPSTVVLDEAERALSEVAAVRIRIIQANHRIKAKPEAIEVTPSVFGYWIRE